MIGRFTILYDWRNCEDCNLGRVLTICTNWPVSYKSSYWLCLFVRSCYSPSQTQVKYIPITTTSCVPEIDSFLWVIFWVKIQRTHFEWWLIFSFQRGKLLMAFSSQLPVLGHWHSKKVLIELARFVDNIKYWQLDPTAMTTEVVLLSWYKWNLYWVIWKYFIDETL